MTFLDDFHTQQDGKVCISAEQAGSFAKNVAGDFNPIHTPGARRFCVPGDLLFALVLQRYGMSQRMSVHFSGMVGADQPLIFPEVEPDFQFEGVDIIDIKDEQDKAYLHLERSGLVNRDDAQVMALMRCYVEFSGHNFPFILVPLMEKHQVMFNPKRPMVIYQSMAFDLQDLNIASPSLQLTDAQLRVEGRRGAVSLFFDIWDRDRCVGQGNKRLIVSDLKPYDAQAMANSIQEFEQLKAAHHQSTHLGNP